VVLDDAAIPALSKSLSYEKASHARTDEDHELAIGDLQVELRTAYV
jgi:hypothetical protein